MDINLSHSSENAIGKSSESIKFVQLISGVDHSNVINEMLREAETSLDKVTN